MPNALPRPLRTLSRFALASLTAVGITPPVLAADPPGAIEKMLVEDSSLTLHLRTYTMDRRKPGPVLNEAWAAGGWLDYRWGWLGDMLGFGLVGYTSQPLWAPSDAAGTLLLTSTQDGYPVLGQAYVSLRLWEQTLTGGRFAVNQPEVNPQDNRMAPNTFQGGRLSGTLGGVNYFGADLQHESVGAPERRDQAATERRGHLPQRHVDHAAGRRHDARTERRVEPEPALHAA